LNKPVLLLLNGEVPDPALVRRLARRCGAVLCADGGARHAAALGLEPDFIVGDMDSVPRGLPKKWRRAVYWCDFDPNRSDFEKALELVRAIGCRRLYVAGALGGRLDHALVNLALAGKQGPSLSLLLVDRGVAELLGPGCYRLGLPLGARLSLLAAGSARLSATGLKYPLKKARLEPGSRGLGNVVTGDVSLTVHSGVVWAMS
jgi:thiamine pyrophosphokinase